MTQETNGSSLTAIAERDAMRDRAITAEQERDRLRAEVTDLLPEADAKQHFATRALRAEERLDRLRREVDALRDEMREWCHGLDTAACHRAVIYGPTIDRLDAILRGES